MSPPLAKNLLLLVAVWGITQTEREPVAPKAVENWVSRPNLPVATLTVRASHDWETHTDGLVDTNGSRRSDPIVPRNNNIRRYSSARVVGHPFHTSPLSRRD